MLPPLSSFTLHFSAPELSSVGFGFNFQKGRKRVQREENEPEISSKKQKLFLSFLSPPTATGFSNVFEAGKTFLGFHDQNGRKRCVRDECELHEIEAKKLCPLDYRRDECKKSTTARGNFTVRDLEEVDTSPLEGRDVNQSGREQEFEVIISLSPRGLGVAQNWEQRQTAETRVGKIGMTKHCNPKLTSIVGYSWVLANLKTSVNRKELSVHVGTCLTSYCSTKNSVPCFSWIRLPFSSCESMVKGVIFFHLLIGWIYSYIYFLSRVCTENHPLLENPFLKGLHKKNLLLHVDPEEEERRPFIKRKDQCVQF